MAGQSGKGRALYAVVLAGAIIGGLLISPVGAHVGKRLPHLRQHLDNFFLTDAEGDNQYLGKNAKAADSDKLDGLDSTAFVTSTTGKAADADKLDGLNSTDFLRSTGKAVDADKLDNIDSTAFLQGTSVLTGTRSCPGAGFDPESTATNYSTSTVGERVATTANTFRCAIDLPNGATVTGVSFRVNDTATAGVISNCALIRTNLTGTPAEDNVNTPPGATANGSGVQTVTGTVIPANATIANGTYGYSLGCDLGDDTGIFGAIVTYTVPASAG